MPIPDTFVLVIGGIVVSLLAIGCIGSICYCYYESWVRMKDEEKKRLFNVQRL